MQIGHNQPPELIFTRSIDFAAPKYPVGFKFTPVGRKHSKEITVVDYLVTRNLAGEIVKTRYVTQHEFMGQMIFDTDVVQTTIDRAVIK